MSLAVIGRSTGHCCRVALKGSVREHCIAALVSLVGVTLSGCGGGGGGDEAGSSSQDQPQQPIPPPVAQAPAPVDLNVPAIGPIQFIEVGGRPLHEGTFPVDSAGLVAGSQTTVSISLLGPIQEGFIRLVDDGGSSTAASSCELLRVSDIFAYCSAVISVPLHPFRVIATAVTPSGSELTAQTDLITPGSVALSIVLPSATMSRGDSERLQLLVRGATPDEQLALTLMLPDGFSATALTWTVPASADGTATVATTITAPTGEPFQRYTLSATAFDSSGVRLARASVDLEVD